MIQGIIACGLLMGLVGLEVCQWRLGVPLIIVWGLLMGLIGLLWVMILNIFGEGLPTHDNRLAEIPLSEPHDVEDPHGGSS